MRRTYLMPDACSTRVIEALPSGQLLLTAGLLAHGCLFVIGCGQQTDAERLRCDDPCTCEGGRGLSQVKPLESDVYLVVDASGSMTEPLSQLHSQGSRWEALVDGMVEAVRAMTELGHRHALYTFPDIERVVRTGDRCAVSTHPLVGLGQDARDTTRTLKKVTPDSFGDTPMLSVLEQVRESLRQNGSVRPKVVVLGTDGLPNCDRDQSEDAVRNVATLLREMHDELGVPTAIFGMDTQETFLRQSLNFLAESGGIALQQQQSFYEVGSPDSLVEALERVSITAANCRFRLPEREQNVTDEKLRFRFEDRLIAPDMENGWSFSSEARDEIELNGSACEALRSGEGKSLRAFLAPSYCAPLREDSVDVI